MSKISITRLLGLGAVLEAVTGLVLMIHPPLVAWLLLGEGVSGVAVALGRVAGVALVALGIGCWPGSEVVAAGSPALRALLTYNLLATLYLAYLGIDGRMVGNLLWPAVVLHAVMTLLLARASRSAVRVGRWINDH